jgi:hypothetical protein
MKFLFFKQNVIIFHVNDLFFYFEKIQYICANFLFLSNFVNRDDIVAVNFVERCESRALVEVMQTVLSEFPHLSGKHSLWNSHVDLGQGVNSLDYSGVMSLNLK